MTSDAFSVLLVLGPTSHLKVDCTDEVLALIKVHFDLLLAVGPGQELLRVVHQLLVLPRLIGSQFHKAYDHPGLNLLEDLHPAAREDLPKLGVNGLPRRLRSLFSWLDLLVRKFRLPAYVGVLMARK